MQVNSLMMNPGPTIYYNDVFRSVLEDHLTLLKNHSETKVITVEPMIAYRFEFDFFSMLSYFGLPSHLHWLIMRMNDFLSPLDNTRDLTNIIIPSGTTVDTIRQSHMTTRKIS